jgi:ketosteroid isomerase-like protein
MRDPMAPAMASHPAEAVELVSMAVSDGDLEAALAQYEPDAVLRLWQGQSLDGDLVSDGLTWLINLRLPLAVRVRAVVPSGELALVLGERHMVGPGPDCDRVDLSGFGATVVRRQPGGTWRIAADAWYLSGSGAAGSVPPSIPLCP